MMKIVIKDDEVQQFTAGGSGVKLLAELGLVIEKVYQCFPKEQRGKALQDMFRRLMEDDSPVWTAEEAPGTVALYAKKGTEEARIVDKIIKEKEARL